MKILMISSIPENLENITGGVESVTVNLLYGFSSLDVELNVITFGSEIKKHYIYNFSPNVKIYYHPYRFVKSTKLFFYFIGAGIVLKHVKLFKPDVIHSQGNGSTLFLLKKLKGRNVVITPHADLKNEYKNMTSLKKKLNHKIVILIQNVFMKRFPNYIFISEYLKNSLAKNNALGAIKSQVNIFNPVKPVFFDVKDNDLIHRLNILYVGLITKRKGLIDLIRSLTELKNKEIIYQLNVVGGFGDNVYKDMVLSAVKENNLDDQVTFHGWLSQKNIVKLMEKNGIFILPSNQESLPMSIIEAMSSGRLVIASDVGGISEIIKNEETGYLYKKNDVKQLSFILENLFNNSSEFQRISNNARVYAKNNFSPLMIANKTKEFYSTVITRNLISK